MGSALRGFGTASGIFNQRFRQGLPHVKCTYAVLKIVGPFWLRFCSYRVSCPGLKHPSRSRKSSGRLLCGFQRLRSWGPGRHRLGDVRVSSSWLLWLDLASPSSITPIRVLAFSLVQPMFDAGV